MRELKVDEIGLVAGAGGRCCVDECQPGNGKGKGKGPQGNNGYGNGGHDGIPGGSGKNITDDVNR